MIIKCPCCHWHFKFNDELEIRTRAISLNEILSIVSTKSKVPVEVIKGKLREANAVLARHTYIYLARNYTPVNQVQIGRFIGRDHTTVIHALNKISDRLETNDPDCYFVRECEYLIKSMIEDRAQEPLLKAM